MDVSFYKFALSVQPPPQPFAASPTTLLTLLRAVVDVLIEQQISATLWLKLPPGIWHSEIQRYHEQVQPQTIYLVVPPGTTNTNIYKFPVVPAQLKSHNPQRREYFFAVSSPAFCCLILAYRLGVKQRQNVKEKAASLSTLSSSVTPTIRKRQPIVAISSFATNIVQPIIDNIQKATVLANEEETAKSPQCPPEATSGEATTQETRLNQVLIRQIYHQEQIRNRNKSRRVVAANKASRLAKKQATNLSLKDDFLSELCQELRTPLAQMKMALSLLASPQLKPVQRQRYLQVLNTQCDRQNSLINGLLDLIQLDRASATPLQPVRLSEIVPGVVSTYQPLAQEKGIMLAYTVPEDLPAVSCVNAWLKQIVINLLHNSIKFTPANGQVWVRSRLQGDFVQLEFRDTGIGIAPSEIPKIFDRFYRVRPAAGDDTDGAGLGLTIVQQLLLRCGGSISVRSKLGEGSTFNVLLPVDSSGATAG